MSFLKEKEKKAFFKLLELDQATGMLKKHLGWCIKMLPADLNEGPLLLVSSCSTFPDQGSVIHGSKVVAKQCFGEDTIDVDISKLTTNEGAAFLVCNDINEEFLAQGEHRSPPAHVSAYVVQDKEILELKFQKTEFGSYKFGAEASIQANQSVCNLELGKAVGAPIIIEGYPPKRSNVVGVLDVMKSDGSLYPVFFNDNFNVDSKRKRTPSEKSGAPFQETTGEAGGKGESSGVNSFGNDKTDSPVRTVPIKETSPKYDTKFGYGNNQPVGQQTVQEQQQPGSASKMVSGKQTGAANLFAPATKCIKSYTLADAPHTHQLFQKLEERMDPKMPMGNDYRLLADKFEYTNSAIHLLSSSRGSPTGKLLSQLRTNTTLQVLHDKLSSIVRDDAVKDMEKYFTQQGCNCENCCSIR